MKRIIIAGALMVLIIASTSAFADPADTKPYKWTGFYAGVQGSYDVGSSNWDFTPAGGHTDHSLNGGMGGFHVGYNYQTPINVVVGIESEINYGKITGSSVCPNPSVSCNSEINWVGSTRARVGYAVWRFFPYIAVGVSYNNVLLRGNNIATGVEITRTENYYFGWTPSIGIEFAITKNLLASVEYAYYDFGKRPVEFSDYETMDSKIKLQTFKLGLSWKF
jgi:outer membrane immunogenic protein